MTDDTDIDEEVMDYHMDPPLCQTCRSRIRTYQSEEYVMFNQVRGGEETQLYWCSVDCFRLRPP